MDNTETSVALEEKTSGSKETKKRPGKKSGMRRRIQENQMKHNRILVAVLLLAVVIVAVVGIVTKDRSFSDTENRSLTQRPGFTWSALADGSLFTQTEQWFSDQFPGRDRWISLHLWEVKRLGQKSSSGVHLGKQGQLLSDPETPDQEALSRTIEAINSFASANSDITSQVMVVPGAAAIQADILPKNAPVRDQLQDISQLQSQLSGQVQVLDAASVLAAHSEEYIYYKTDHHWTSLGAYYVYQGLCSQMGLTERSFQVYSVATDFEGTLASRSGSHKVTDTVEIYAPQEDFSYYVSYGDDSGKVCSIYSREALEEKDKYTVFFGGNHPKVEITTTANNGRTLLLFKDSYANSFVQFLLEDYEKIIMIDPRYFYDSLDAVMNAGVTDVLFLYSADTLVTDTSLADVLEAG